MDNKEAQQQRENASSCVNRSVEWTREKTLRLLREYQQRRVLWDWNAKGYRDRVKRKRAIQDLAVTIGCNSLELEKKITNLKCQYSREVHKIQNSKEAGNGPDDIYVSKWFAFKSMTFLQFGTRRCSARKKQQKTIEEEEEYIVSDIDPESITFVESNDEDMTNGSATGSYNASMSDADHEEESLSACLMMAAQMDNERYGNSPSDILLNNRSQDGQIEAPDEIRKDTSGRTLIKEEYVKFGESIALQIAEIPDSYSRSVAKLRINQILFEAEIGERFDVAIRANQNPGRYVIGIQGFEDCRGLLQEAYLDYNDENNSKKHLYRADEFYVNQYYEKEENSSYKNYCNVEFNGKRTVCSMNLKGLSTNNDNKDNNNDNDNNDNNNNKLKESSVKTIYVPFDVQQYDDIDDGMTDFSFNIYEFSYYPSFLSSGTRRSSTRIAQVNRMTFDYPPSPILSQPEAVPDDMICSIEKRGKICNNMKKTFCQCTQILRLEYSKNFDIFLIDEGFGGNTSHTFHVHGYNVGVVGIGQFDRPTRMKEIVKLNDEGILRRDNKAIYGTGEALLRKDTFVVPNKGYLILRIHTDNLGYWLWEARSTEFYGGNNGQPAMQFVMLVGNRENLPTVPIDFPTCGNHKSPASIFHDTD